MRKILPDHRDIPETIPPGPTLLIDPRRGCDLFELGEETKDAIVTKQARESPYLAHVRLDNVVIPIARRLQFKAEIDSLVSAVNGEVPLTMRTTKTRSVSMSVCFCEAETRLSNA